MNDQIQLHTVVALLDEVPATHFETGQQLVLRRGQMGTVVLVYDPRTVEVEFAGSDGRAYALLPLAVDKLMVLRDRPELVTT